MRGRRLSFLIGVFCLALLAPVGCQARVTPAPTPGHPDVPESSPTSCCPDIPSPTVTIRVEPVSLQVGDTLTIVPSVSGYAYPASVDLYVDAVHIARIGWQDGQTTRYENVPILGISSATEGERAFVLEAIAAGDASVEVSAYGDAEFCTCVDGRPSVGTTFKTVRSGPVSVTVLPPDDP